MSEEWRVIEGWEGYEISSKGRVRSRTRVRRMGDSEPPVWRTFPGKMRKLGNSRGYSMIMLRDAPRKAVNASVHRLVLETFVGPCPEGMEARHLNGNRQDNRVENLAWGTRVENNADRVVHGTHPQASRTTCPRGHPYDHVRPSGSRRCTKCDAAGQRARQAAKKKKMEG